VFVNIKGFIRKAVRKFGYDIVPYSSERKYPIDFTEEEINVIKAVEPYTVTTVEKIYGLIQAVKYIVYNNIPGDFVECGVWRGGSIMVIAKTLLHCNQKDRKIYLFDTFEGMTEPKESIDESFEGMKAAEKYKRNYIDEKSTSWLNAPIEQVKEAVYSTGYDESKFIFVKGRVEKTLPHYAPNKISLLRLDTDWYESTKYELTHLYPRLSKGGILILDDYGHWKGVKKATDEYFSEHNVHMLFTRMDYAGRMGIKLN